MQIIKLPHLPKNYTRRQRMWARVYLAALAVNRYSFRKVFPRPR